MSGMHLNYWALPSFDHRVGNSLLSYEATCRFAFAATRRFARLTKWTFVRELRASDYPWLLPQATWV